MKNSICNENIHINNNDSIPLSGFTNNQVHTYGTSLAKITLNNKTVPQKFHVVPNSVRMHEFDVILGIDFLTENGIIIDYGKRIVYTNPNCIQITYNPSVLSILKNNKLKIKHKNKETQNSIRSTCQNVKKTNNSKTNIPLMDSTKDVIYTSNEKLLNEFIESNFNEEILKEIINNGYNILIGCKQGKIFCLKDKNYTMDDPSVKSAFARTTLTKKETTPTVTTICTSNTFEMRQPVYNIYMISENANGENCSMSEGRRPVNSCSQIDFLTNLCSSDINICNVNDGNVVMCLISLFE